MSDFASWLRTWTTNRVATQTERESTSAKLPLPVYFRAPGGEQPGQYPFSRGVSERGYLDEPWVMGLYSGYASPSETNARFKSLLATGQTGLSIALDLPTQIGIDSDHSLAVGEIGKVGVPLNSVEDMLTLLDGLPIHQIRQMRTTANAIAPVFLAFALVALEELGIDPGSFRLFLQNDPLKEYPARGTWIFPPKAAQKLAVDVVEYMIRHHPTWQPMQFCGYHIRDAGGTAVHEVAVATANGIAYLEEAQRRGLHIEELTPTMFMMLGAGLDIFEEAAKFRAARRLWARLLHERYGVPKEKAAIKIFSYTLGSALAAKEPANNITRIAYEALAAVLGGAQTLATSSWDEAHSLPSEDAANLSVRAQQILAYETGVTNVVDPLGGSYYVEHLTDSLVSAMAQEVATILEHGGAVAAIENDFTNELISAAAYRDFQDVTAGRRVIVGVNYKAKKGVQGWTSQFKMPPSIAEGAIASLARLKASRDSVSVSRALKAVYEAATKGENVVPALIAAARVRATLGEMIEALASVYGRYGSAVATSFPPGSVVGMEKEAT